MEFKLWLNEQEQNSPKIIAKRDEYDSDGYIDILFPSGSIWRYLFPDQFTLNKYYNYRLNVGRLVSKMKQEPRIKQQQIR